MSAISDTSDNEAQVHTRNAITLDKRLHTVIIVTGVWLLAVRVGPKTLFRACLCGKILVSPSTTAPAQAGK